MYVSSDNMIHPSAGGYSVSSRVCRLDHRVQPDRVLTRIDVLPVSWSAILNLCRHASMILTGPPSPLRVRRCQAEALWGLQDRIYVRCPDMSHILVDAFWSCFCESSTVALWHLV